MSHNIICVICPLGCNMKVQIDGRKITDVQGNKCKKGVTYAEHEIFSPSRILTTTVRTHNIETPLLPVRSDKAIPKDRLMDCMTYISKHATKGPIRLGQTVIENILDLDANIVACRSFPLEIPNAKTG